MKKMKKINLLLFSFCLMAQLCAQNDTSKIKVYLLGTFHFGATSDANKTSFKDLYSVKRQTELNEIVNSFIKAKTSKIFVEFPYYAQKELDSLGKMYIQDPNKDTVAFRNEIFQVAFRAAKISPAIKVVAVDRQLELPMYKLEEFDAFADSNSTAPFFNKPYRVGKKQKKLSEITLQEHFLQINSHISRKAHLSDFLHFALASTQNSNFAGTEFTVSWYERNLKIFTNILRNIDPDKDKAIVVLLGSSHTATVRSFFVDHDRFEIVELEDLFKLR
jgi:Family of unknown function (DUF5694)